MIFSKKAQLFILQAMFSIALFAQDKLIDFDSKINLVKIIEVNDSFIKYKEWDNLDGPLFVTNKNNIATIIYESGKAQVLMQKAKTLEEIVAYQKQLKRINNPYKHSLAFDLFALIPGLSSSSILEGISTIGIAYEYRGPKSFISHKFNVYVQYIDYNEGLGSFYVSYNPKFFFYNHKVGRFYMGPELGFGMHQSSIYEQDPSGSGVTISNRALAIQPALSFGFNIHPSEHLFMETNFSAGPDFHNDFKGNKDTSAFWRVGFLIGGIWGKK